MHKHSGLIVSLFSAVSQEESRNSSVLDFHLWLNYVSRTTLLRSLFVWKEESSAKSAMKVRR